MDSKITLSGYEKIAVLSKLIILRISEPTVSWYENDETSDR